MNTNEILKKVAVLCGGDSKEREVSLRSGAAVCKALIESGINAELLDIKKLSEVNEGLKKYSSVFIAMHGDWGEDGELQAKLSELNIPYTGSNPEASSNAMNKWKSRELFEKAGIKIPAGVLCQVNNIPDLSVLKTNDIVVKPESGGSTVGITIIKNYTREKLLEAIEFARESYAGDVLIEEYIEGREVTASVWENKNEIQALPLIEIVPKIGFYDYKNKYTSGATEYIVPAKIDEKISKGIQEAAVKAHEVLGCNAYSRADFRLKPNGEFYILEVNTAPGMTATSLVPKAAAAIGVNMPEFVKHILLMAHI